MPNGPEKCECRTKIRDKAKKKLRTGMMKICPHKSPRLSDYETTKHLVCHLKESSNVITIISFG